MEKKKTSLELFRDQLLAHHTARKKFREDSKLYLFLVLSESNPGYLEGGYASESEVVISILKYVIRIQGFLTKSSGLIKCDRALKQVFGADYVHMRQLVCYVQKLFFKEKPNSITVYHECGTKYANAVEWPIDSSSAWDFRERRNDAIEELKSYEHNHVVNFQKFRVNKAMQDIIKLHDDSYVLGNTVKFYDIQRAIYKYMRVNHPVRCGSGNPWVVDLSQDHLLSQALNVKVIHLIDIFKQLRDQLQTNNFMPEENEPVQNSAVECPTSSQPSEMEEK